MFKLFTKNQGFSLIELLTVLAIVLTLTGVGITSFKKSVNRSRMTEAKNSLSFVYTSQKKFYNEWGSYHSNLVAIGAVPQSSGLNYDVGFESVPEPLPDYISDNPAFLTLSACITWSKICTAPTACQPSSAGGQIFNCSIASTTKISDAVGTYTASPGGFGAGAISNKVENKDGGNDEWSINSDGILQHP